MIRDVLIGWIPPISAGLLSALLGFVELSSGRRKPLSIRAWHWILGRLAIDGTTGAVAYGILAGALQGLDWFNGPVPVLVAALAGPAILRSRLNVINVGTGGKMIGIRVHEQLLRRFDDQIDDIGAEAQARWRREISATIAVISLADFAKRADAYLQNLDRLRSTLQEEREWLAATATEEATLQETRRDTIIQRLLDLGGRRFLVGLARECEQLERPQRPGGAPDRILAPLPQHPLPEPQPEGEDQASRP